MHAVLIEVDVSGVEREAGLRVLREQVVPAITGLPGFRSGRWLTGGEGGTGLSLTVWDGPEHARSMAERFGRAPAGADGPAVIRCEIREVAATA